MSSARHGIAGTIRLRDSLIEADPTSCATGTWNSDAYGVVLDFVRDSIWNWGNAARTHEVIASHSGLQQRFGGMHFDDCVLVTVQPSPLVAGHRDASYDPEGPAAFANVTGQIPMVDPYGAEIDPGTVPPHDVTLSLDQEDASVVAQVAVVPGPASVTGGNAAELVFRRVGGDLAMSLAVAYRVGGNARQRHDYGGLGEVAVIPAGQREISVPVRTFARRRDSEPEVRELVVSVAPGHRYRALSHNPAVITIRD